MSIFKGIVIRGKGEARTLGYPTANIDYASAEILGAGVWLCFIEIDGKKYQGLAIVDMWKQKNGLPSIEVHVLDFSGDVYGQMVSVDVFKKVRDLEKFVSIDHLIGQIQKDVAIARLEFNQLQK